VDFGARAPAIGLHFDSVGQAWRLLLPSIFLWRRVRTRVSSGARIIRKVYAVSARWERALSQVMFHDLKRGGLHGPCLRGRENSPHQHGSFTSLRERKDSATASVHSMYFVPGDEIGVGYRLVAADRIDELFLDAPVAALGPRRSTRR